MKSVREDKTTSQEHAKIRSCSDRFAEALCRILGEPKRPVEWPNHQGLPNDRLENDC